MPGFDLSQYEPVEDRIRDFWSDYPEGRIETEMLHVGTDGYIVKAIVWRDGTWSYPSSTGLAQEAVTDRGVNSTSALENCETSAIGRALANLGYSAKGKRPSREEMRKVSAGTTGTAPAAPPKQVVRPESPSAASEPAPAAGGATSEGASLPASDSGDVAPPTTSPEDRDAGTVAEGASGGTTSGEAASGGRLLGEGPALAASSDPTASPADWARAARALKTTRPLAQAEILKFLANAGTGRKAPNEVSVSEIDWALSSIALARRTA